MQHIIKDRQIVVDHCQHLNLNEPLVSGDISVPLQRWLQESELLLAHPGRIGVSVEGDDDLNLLQPHLNALELIALHFPRLGDGRSYSQARLLRERYGYTGELRAIGDILLDQVYFMSRCGINAIALRADQNLATALRQLNAFDVQYQAASDNRGPLFRHRRQSFVEVNSL